VNIVLSWQTFTESQNVRGWQGPLWVTQSNPLPKQGHPEQAAQHRSQAGLESLQRRRLHSLPGEPGPGLLTGKARCTGHYHPDEKGKSDIHDHLYSSRALKEQHFKAAGIPAQNWCLCTHRSTPFWLHFSVFSLWLLSTCPILAFCYFYALSLILLFRYLRISFLSSSTLQPSQQNHSAARGRRQLHLR